MIFRNLDDAPKFWNYCGDQWALDEPSRREQATELRVAVGKMNQVDEGKLRAATGKTNKEQRGQATDLRLAIEKTNNVDEDEQWRCA